MARVRVPIKKDADQPAPVQKQEPTSSSNEPLQQLPSTEVSPVLIFIKRHLKMLIGAGIALVVIILLITLINDRNKLADEVNNLKSSGGQTQNSSQSQEASQLKQKIGQYIQLPSDEEPTVATVVDADRVKGQSFFKDSQNGDKVLLFAKAGKAILYRPGTDKVIEVAPINQNSKNLLNQTQQTP